MWCAVQPKRTDGGVKSIHFAAIMAEQKYHTWTPPEQKVLLAAVRVHGTNWDFIHRTFLEHIPSDKIKNKFYSQKSVVEQGKRQSTSADVALLEKWASGAKKREKARIKLELEIQQKKPMAAQAAQPELATTGDLIHALELILK